RRGLAILTARTQEDRAPLYQELLKVTNQTVDAAERLTAALTTKTPPRTRTKPKFIKLVEALQHHVGLARGVVAQTHRRVILGETVPATEKVVSIFEPHTDIIVKDRRDTLYGHKVFFTGGTSCLIVDWCTTV